MKQTQPNVSIGLDIAKDTLDALAIDVATGQVLEQGQWPSQWSNATVGIDALRAHLEAAPFTIDRIVVEATGSYHRALVEHLVAHGLPVSVINPLQHRRFAQMQLRRSKTDRLDALTLAQYGRERRPACSLLPQAEQQQLKHLTALRELMVRQRTQVMNLHHSVERDPALSDGLLAEIEAQRLHLDQTVAKLEHEQQRLIETAFARVGALMRSVPGIGPQTVALMVAYMGDLSTFATAKKMSAFVGLDPKLWESGQYKGHVHISKQGHARLRRLLYQGARSAARHNAGCRALYERLVARGKAPKVAYVAVANKLLRQVRAVVRRGVPYDPDYAAKRGTKPVAA